MNAMSSLRVRSSASLFRGGGALPMSRDYSIFENLLQPRVMGSCGFCRWFAVVQWYGIHLARDDVQCLEICCELR